MNKVKIYECSSAGDKRFSALHAQVSNSKGVTHTIEYWYQVVIKGYKNIKDGKGKKGKLYDYTTQKIWYFKLWRAYLEQNPKLLRELIAIREAGYTLNDKFAKGDAVNQAKVLTVATNQRKMYIYSTLRGCTLETVARTRKEALRNFNAQCIKATGKRDYKLNIKNVKEAFEL